MLDGSSSNPNSPSVFKPFFKALLVASLFASIVAGIAYFAGLPLILAALGAGVSVAIHAPKIVREFIRVDEDAAPVVELPRYGRMTFVQNGMERVQSMRLRGRSRLVEGEEEPKVSISSRMSI